MSCSSSSKIHIVSSMFHLLHLFPNNDNFITKLYKNGKEIVVIGDCIKREELKNQKIKNCCASESSLKELFNLLKSTNTLPSYFEEEGLQKKEDKNDNNVLYRKTDENQILYQFYSLLKDVENLNELKFKIPFKFQKLRFLSRNYVFLIDCPICLLKLSNTRNNTYKLSNDSNMLEIQAIFQQLLFNELKNLKSEFIFVINHHSSNLKDSSQLPDTWCSYVNTVVSSPSHLPSNSISLPVFEERLKKCIDQMFNVSLIDINDELKTTNLEDVPSSVTATTNLYKSILQKKEETHKCLVRDYFACPWLEEHMNSVSYEEGIRVKKPTITNSFYDMMGIKENVHVINPVYSQNSLLETTYFNQKIKEEYHTIKKNKDKFVFIIHIGLEINYNVDNLIYHCENLI